MSISHGDFLRILPRAIQRAVSQMPVDLLPSHLLPFRRLGDHGLWIGVAGGWLDIELGPEQSRRLASLTLPCTMVVFNFYGRSRREAKAMMEQIDFAYRRGGG